ncbi:MAG: hypothetical protein JSW34_08625 [Candidatus Zixiibacteriota bacterium]|nr:MAG: hypothetical protein JSW34_08625 [candidate division Zixibacteria bacterium]
MDFSQDFMIDLGLNMGGYLLAGVLAVVVYSLFSRRGRVSAATKKATAGDGASIKESAEQSEKRRVEFIKLGESAGASRSENKAATADGSDGNGERRDRAAIMRIAGSMLTAGASHDKIRKVLPVSEAELSLLEASRT